MANSEQNPSGAPVLLEARELVKHFPVKTSALFAPKRYVKAVDGVTFTVHENETLGLVGESGCGKTTLGKMLLRLIEPTAGQVLFEGEDVLRTSSQQLRKMRRRMQIIYQDPFSSLNPRMNVGDIIGEPLYVQDSINGQEKLQRVYELLDVVGLPRASVKKYPHEFSGGQRQRIGIARALILRPKLIVCDEAVSALDVATQSQIINLLEDLQKQFGQAYVFIAHGLSVVKHISDRVAVMYLGKIVELAKSDTLYAHPLHPYTQALFSAAPIPDPTVEKQRILLEGDVPSPMNPPSGCRFHTRCRMAMSLCSESEPPFCEVRPGHFAACHLLSGKTANGPSKEG
ncbi:ABC transporter ATP-binding protein [Anaerotruncus rubiinfantis]|uniref:ABC transporter ATP-binding protein n=1 Tax=Anaerotruncus rubiinfantis TaxID=1720200 RepID=UPI0034A563C5